MFSQQMCIPVLAHVNARLSSVICITMLPIHPKLLHRMSKSGRVVMDLRALYISVRRGSKFFSLASGCVGVWAVAACGARPVDKHSSAASESAKICQSEEDCGEGLHCYNPSTLGGFGECTAFAQEGESCASDDESPVV